MFITNQVVQVNVPLTITQSDLHVHLSQVFIFYFQIYE